MLITNFQYAVCKCVYVDRVGFISDVFAIVVQISDVKRSKLAIFFFFIFFFSLNVSIKNMAANIYVQDCVENKTRLS